MKPTNVQRTYNAELVSVRPTRGCYVMERGGCVCCYLWWRLSGRPMSEPAVEGGPPEVLARLWWRVPGAVSVTHLQPRTQGLANSTRHP